MSKQSPSQETEPDDNEGPGLRPAVVNTAGGNRWFRNDWLIASILFFATVGSRLPFRTSMLYAWDSILYARALDRFDVSLHQPHPPGHIFYVALIWAVNRLIDNPNAAMVWISVFASAAAVTAIFWLGRMMFNRRTGIWAALLLATSLSFWTHSEVALPYTLLGFLSILVAVIVYQVWEGNRQYVIASALALGFASGFRQDLLFFLLPLLAVAVWRVSRTPPRDISRLGIKAAVALAASTSCWYIPSAILSGGFSSYRQASSSQTDFLLRYSSVFGNGGLHALGVNLLSFIHFLVWAAAAALPLLAALFILMIWGKSRLHDKRLLFLILWSAPGVAFFILIHVGELGYVFTVLPPLLLAASWGADEAVRFASERFGRDKHAFGSLLLTLFPALLISVNVLMFLFISPKQSARSLRSRDEVLAASIDTVKKNFDANSTLLITVYEEQHLGYYLPEYQRVRGDAMVRENMHVTLPENVKCVVIFDKRLLPPNDSRVDSLPLPDDEKLNFIRRQQGKDVLSIDWEQMRVDLS